MDIKQIVTDASTIIQRLAPVVETLVPASASAIAAASKILTGVVQGEAAAVNLYNTIVSGEVPSEDELRKYFSDYEAAYQQLHADLVLGS